MLNDAEVAAITAFRDGVAAEVAQLREHGQQAQVDLSAITSDGLLVSIVENLSAPDA